MYFKHNDCFKQGTFCTSAVLMQILKMKIKRVRVRVEQFVSDVSLFILLLIFLKCFIGVFASDIIQTLTVIVKLHCSHVGETIRVEGRL